MTFKRAILVTFNRSDGTQTARIVSWEEDTPTGREHARRKAQEWLLKPTVAKVQITAPTDRFTGRKGSTR